MALLRNKSIFIGRSLRGFCTGQDNLVNITKDEATGFTTVSMSKLPVNTLDLNMLRKLRDTFSDLEKVKCRGMILTSEASSVFSAGLEIMELYKSKPENIKTFFTMLQDVWINLYSSPYPTVAAINGHSPAGGCLLALSCEYRIMVRPKFTIGLNESQLGIIAPRWLRDCMRNTIGERKTELALTKGKLFSADEALEIGLIDEVAEDKADALKKAEDFLLSTSNIPGMARSLVKNAVRQDTLNRLLEDRESDCRIFVDHVIKPEIQKYLETYVEALKRKKK